MLDVVAHPLESGDLIEQSLVSGRGNFAVGEIGETQESERPHPIIDCNHDHIATAGEARAVIYHLGAGADPEGTPVNPDHHRTPLVVRLRGPDVEMKAVLRLRLFDLHSSKHDRREAKLRAGRAKVA